MITTSNLPDALMAAGFEAVSPSVFRKGYQQQEFFISVRLDDKVIEYPKEITVNQRMTCNFSDNENFVVLECVDRLLEKGYRPEHIELEKAWHLGHDAKGGRADICVSGDDGKMLFIIECKTHGAEFDKALKQLKSDGGQLFSYWQQERSSQWLLLYSSDFDGQNISYATESVKCGDDENILHAAKNNPDIPTYSNAHTVVELFMAWSETYDKRLCGDVVFRDDSAAYQIGVKPLRKSDLKDFSEASSVVNSFEEILRHNNVSDKENAFNRLVALFLCKIVDESRSGENDILDFQYKVGSDTYEVLQDRLQRLYRDGMEQFMREKIFYIGESYVEDTLSAYKGGNRKNLISSLKETMRKLKFYTNNDFAFKDVHNEELFYQNGKILVEMIQLFQPYRIVGSNDLQTLGDMFEQLLSKGFKQNEGQFFTPIPIARFIWHSLPLERIIESRKGKGGPYVVDYACGAGHFLTEGFRALNAFADFDAANLYGVEKDYRLARVSRISLFMHGAGSGSAIFGDGLENYPDKGISVDKFDILAANPPYSVDAFKPHLKLKNNFLKVLDKITNDGSEIETLFAERIAQLVRHGGAAAVIMPSSILTTENASFIAARESLLKNFLIRAVVNFGSKTFGETGTNTIVLFLEKFSSPREPFAIDCTEAIISGADLSNWEDEHVFAAWLSNIKVNADVYREFTSGGRHYDEWRDDPYFGVYTAAFEKSQDYKSKTDQKTFLKADPAARLKTLDDMFYNFALAAERDKLMYFAMIYNQETLVITSPSGNEEQKKFLGYDWSKRKGREGIQIINPGGMLYSEDDIRAEGTAAALIRAAYRGEAAEAPALDDYFCRLRLRDMLDFTGTKFTKTIKTAVVVDETEIYSGKYPAKTIAEAAPYVSERIDISDFDISSYITTDNMIKGKKGILPFDGGAPALSSATAYMAGDVLVSNIRPYLKKIWLADRNGGCSNDVLVFRSFNKELLLPKFLFLVLERDYFFNFMMAGAKGMKMPRGDKDKILQYPIPLPNRNEQETIIGVFEDLDREIESTENAFAALAKSVEDKFTEMFVEKVFETRHLRTLCSIVKGDTLTKEEAKGGSVPVVAGGMQPSCYHNEANRPEKCITVSASGANAGFVNFWRIPIFATDCSSILSLDTSVLLNEFLYYYLRSIQSDIFSLQQGRGQPHVYGKDLGNINVPLPPIELQQEFADFAADADRRREEIAEELKALAEKRRALSDEYFG